MPRIALNLLPHPNVAAFLDMVAFSEIGEEMLALSDDGYNVLVGSMPKHMLTFKSYAQHPDIFNKSADSTAAGRYQILHHYWEIYRIRLKLPDFGPVSQDLYAVNQLREQRAIEPIVAGDLPSAIGLCSNIWASLPGNHYGQHMNQYAALKAAYTHAGGTST
jgi:muramidase (phage lysozyme)